MQDLWYVTSAKASFNLPGGSDPQVENHRLMLPKKQLILHTKALPSLPLEKRIQKKKLF